MEGGSLFWRCTHAQLAHRNAPAKTSQDQPAHRLILSARAKTILKNRAKASTDEQKRARPVLKIDARNGQKRTSSEGL
jgi:hypothetical protein